MRQQDFGCCLLVVTVVLYSIIYLMDVFSSDGCVQLRLYKMEARK